MLSASKFVDRINDGMKISELDRRGCHRHRFPKCLRAEVVPFLYLYPLCLVCNSLSTTVECIYMCKILCQQKGEYVGELNTALCNR